MLKQMRYLLPLFLVLVVSAAVTQCVVKLALTEAKAEAKANALFKHLLDQNKANLSWKCFAQAIAAILGSQAKYKQLAPVFNSLKDSQSAKEIGEKLEPHYPLLPAEARQLLDGYFKVQLWRLINWRISLNNKVTCQRLHDEL